MLLEIKPVVVKSDEFGNVSFRYGRVTWTCEAGCDEDLALALWKAKVPGMSLWIDGKPELYSVAK